MSHNINFYDYKYDCDKRKVQSSLDEYVAHEDWQEGASGLPQPIEWKSMSPFKDRDAAYNWINEHDNDKWYWCVAVPYYDYDVRSLHQTLPEREKVFELNKKRDDYIKAHSIKTFKSQYIGCKKCGSKLNREWLRGEHCPLCQTDLRGDTTIETIKNYDRRIEEAKQKATAAEQKKADKTKTVRWLVKIEYHT